MMDAIRGQNEGVIAMLLDNGANPQIQDINGRNAYHEAVSTGRLDIISLVHTAGGNPLSRDKHGTTPFTLAMRQGEPVVRATLGLDRNITDSDGNTPIHIIVAVKGPLNILSTLINEGYPCDTLNAMGQTPLSMAVSSSAERYALLLLQSNANPFTFINRQGQNAVTIAMARNDAQMTEDIAKYAGDGTDIQGNTMLHYAARSGDKEAIKTLLSYGLSRSAKNISGETPADTAKRWQHTDAAAMLE